MESNEDVTKILKKGIRFGAVGRVHSKQIAVAADRIFNSEEITWDVLQNIGKDIAGDRLLFNDVDVDQLQKVLEKMEKAEEVE